MVIDFDNIFNGDHTITIEEVHLINALNEEGTWAERLEDEPDTVEISLDYRQVYATLV